MSSSEMSQFIDEIEDITSLLDSSSAYIPVIMVDKTNYVTYKDTNNIPKIYLFTLVFANLINGFLTSTV